MKRRVLMQGVAGCALALLLGTASAQRDFPNGPVRLVVPFAPGGGVDGAARLVAKQMQDALGVPVVVENRPGANGAIGGRAVQLAEPDGQTLLFSASTQMLTHHVMAAAPYDPVADFSFVARVGQAPLLMVISPTLPQNTLGEVIEAVRTQPSQWTAGLPAFGAASHVGTLMVAQAGKIELPSVVYRGTAPALADVAGGHVQVLVDAIVSLQSMAEAGKVKPIMVTSAERSSVMPNVPTARESGYPDVVTESWYGVWAPRDTPPERIAQINQLVNTAVQHLAENGELARLGIEPVQESPAQFRDYAERYVQDSARLFEAVGFQPQ